MHSPVSPEASYVTLSIYFIVSYEISCVTLSIYFSVESLDLLIFMEMKQLSIKDSGLGLEKEKYHHALF